MVFMGTTQSVKNSGSLLPKWNVSSICRKYWSAQNAVKMVTEQLLRQLPRYHCLHILQHLHLLQLMSSFTRALWIRLITDKRAACFSWGKTPARDHGKLVYPLCAGLFLSTLWAYAWTAVISGSHPYRRNYLSSIEGKGTSSIVYLLYVDLFVRKWWNGSYCALWISARQRR